MTIAGAIHSADIPEEPVTRRMLARSPYFPHSIWREGPIELGAALPHQNPALLSKTQKWIVLFDGCLYNTQEIRREIQRQAPLSPEASTEELIAALYAIHKENALSFLNGNFALALYDTDEKELLLARDRLGEKGLFWSFKDNLFLFANSLKALLHSRRICQTPDLEALSFYLSFGFIPQEKSPIQGVFKLQPGHYLKASSNKELLIRPYWAYSTCLKKKQNGLTDVDVKLAAKEAWEQRIGTAEPTCYALSDAEWKECQGDASDKVVEPPRPQLFTSQNVFADLSAMIWHMDEPVADLSLPALWQTCKQMRAEHKKELFFTTGSLAQLQQEIHPPRILRFAPFTEASHYMKKKVLIPLFHLFHPATAYAMLRSVNTHPWHLAFLDQTALFDRREFKDLHSDLLKPIDSEIFLHRFPALERLGPSLSSLLYLYHKIKLSPSFLMPQEAICSHFGIVKKAPYLDMKVVELLASIPEQTEAFSYTQLFKPGSTRVTPLPAWATEVAIRSLTDKFSRSVLVEAGLFSPRWLSEQMKNFNRHPHLFFKELWALLVLEIWFRHFIEGDLSEPIPK